MSKKSLNINLHIFQIDTPFLNRFIKVKQLNSQNLTLPDEVSNQFVYMRPKGFKELKKVDMDTLIY